MVVLLVKSSKICWCNGSQVLNVNKTCKQIIRISILYNPPLQHKYFVFSELCFFFLANFVFPQSVTSHNFCAFFKKYSSSHKFCIFSQIFLSFHRLFVFLQTLCGNRYSLRASCCAFFFQPHFLCRICIEIDNSIPTLSRDRQLQSYIVWMSSTPGLHVVASNFLLPHSLRGILITLYGDR